MRPAISGLVSLAVVLCALLSPAVVRAGESVPIYVGPRLGPSMVTGYLGIEAQYGDHVAVGGGLMFDDGYAAGIKYLFSPYPGSLYLFGSYLHIKATEGDGVSEPTSERTITNTGVGIGWQKRWRNGFIASAGVGPSYWADPENGSHLMVVLDLSVGYAFGFRRGGEIR